MNERVEIIISGRVQDVLFRATTQDKAKQLNIYGYVRNEPDGTVKIIAEGHKDRLIELVDWCYVGVKHAKVNNEEVSWHDATNEFTDFTIQY